MRPCQSLSPFKLKAYGTRRSKPGHSRIRGLTCVAASTTAQTAKDAVEAGLNKFQERKYEEALALFQSALALDPRPEEAQAALYNSACSQVKLKQWQAATDSVAEAVNSYNLRLKVALEVSCKCRRHSLVLEASKFAYQGSLGHCVRVATHRSISQITAETESKLYNRV